jgi:hypothetical protein
MTHMSAAHIDRISAGYALPFTEQIKYAIRTMPYGELMEMADAVTSNGDITGTATNLWMWANATFKDEKEQTTKERTSISGGLYAP